MKKNYVIGVDFGTDSVRAVVAELSSGTVAGEGSAYYPRWKKGLYKHPEAHIFRQHPLDYLEGLERCVKEALSSLSAEERKAVAAIGMDTTGSTPAPVNREGTPLSMTKEFAGCEDAMFYLWKDHSAKEEADLINEAFTSGPVDYCKYQGKYSSEWYWAKVLHAARTNPGLCEQAYTWVEHSDWIVGVLCGNTRPETLYHNACAAGHKALWHSSWKGLPDGETLGRLHPYLAAVRERYGRAPEPSTKRAGLLTEEWAGKWGLEGNVLVAGSSFDAHAGAVGAGIREGTLVCTIGTSAVDMAVSRAENLEGKDITLYGGQAENSILPGLIGVETGQAAFGDIFAWFKKLLLWPAEQYLKGRGAEELYREMEETLLRTLEDAVTRRGEEEFPVSLDWFNGRRYPDTDDSRRAAIAGLSLASDAPGIYRSLMFGAVCGLKRIVEGLEQAGIEINRVTAVGGISGKSPYVMQLMADLLQKTIVTVNAKETCALGAAMYGAVAAGYFPSLEAAGAVMAAKEEKVYRPDPYKYRFYEGKYREYLALAKAAESL